MGFASRWILPLFAIALAGFFLLAILRVVPSLASSTVVASGEVDLTLVAKDGTPTFGTPTLATERDQKHLTVRNDLGREVTLRVEGHGLTLLLEEGERAEWDIRTLTPGSYTLGLSANESTQALLLVK